MSTIFALTHLLSCFGTSTASRLLRQESDVQEISDSKQRTNKRLLAATRVHFKNQSAPLDVNGIEQLVESCATFADGVIVAVQADAPNSPQAIASLRQIAERVTLPRGVEFHVLPVQPWGRFVASLNALIGFGTEHGYEEILFLSQEVRATPEAVNRLRTELADGKTLVAGARLPDHDFQSGNTLELHGLSSPWNTLALWNLQKLSLTGFPQVGDGLPGRPVAGVEEVSAIALAQTLDPSENTAKLIDLGENGVQWDIASLTKDPKRLEWHKAKMLSKRLRPQAQLAALKIGGTVSHL